MSLALITGIMFARFSRPRARFLFTRNAVVRPIDGHTTLVVRAANERQNIVQDASAQLRLLYDDTTVEGMSLRRIVDLPLVRSQHPMFALGWTIMHVIDDASPLRSETAQSLREKDATFVLSVTGTDDTTGQVLAARTEYTSEDIHWNATFCDLLEEAEDGTLNVDYSRFDRIEPLAKVDMQPRPGG
jgi:inward rectifier potassium channel